MLPQSVETVQLFHQRRERRDSAYRFGTRPTRIGIEATPRQAIGMAA
jgi:hypothetical protein